MRVLPDALEQALSQGERQPAYRILAYNPKLVKISQVVCGTVTYPAVDLTPYCTNISWSPAQLKFTLADPDGLFHPDSGANRKYLADGAIIRLQEGDWRVDPSFWMNTFTGTVHGQIGWQKNRKTGTLSSTVSAYSRDNTSFLKKRQVTTKEYTVGTEVGLMLHDLANTFIGLADDEIRIPSILGMQFLHQVNQICQMAPWEALTTILQCVARVPFFDGDGRLACFDKNMSRLPDRQLPSYCKVTDYQIPERNQDYINKVKVIFLDANLERVESPNQKLGEATVTTGFFTFQQTLDCWWSDDHKQRASATYMRKVKSINDSLVGQIMPIGSEHYEPWSNDLGGTITVDINIWVPILATVMLMEYVGAAFIPDDVIVFSIGLGASAGEGITIPLGRVLQAQALIVILLLMMSLGTGQYEIYGIPYDYAYLEKESTAIEDGLEYWEENQKEIKMDFIGSYEQADYLALIELIWEKSSSYPRRLTIQDDLALETGDILQLPDGRKFLVTNLSKQVKRGEVPLLNLDCFKVMSS